MESAEYYPNIRNKSSIFRYWGVYLIYRSSTVRKSLITIYIGGGGDNIRYISGGDSNSDSKDISKYIGKYTGEDKDEDADKDCLYIYFWQSSCRCRCSRFFDENTISQCLQDGLLHIFSCIYLMRRAIEENEVLQSL